MLQHIFQDFYAKLTKLVSAKRILWTTLTKVVKWCLSVDFGITCNDRVDVANIFVIAASKSEYTDY